MAFKQQLDEYVNTCEAALQHAADKYLQTGSRVSDAARYSLMNGGKRVRGVLTLAVCDMLGAANSAAKRYAAAVEMVHAFSLIHDDLPCMDNDDLRRGKPACHIAYGEDTALLAGDLLSLMAFETIANAPSSAESRIAATALLAHSAGGKGMIYGQELDLEAETRPITLQELKNVHLHKTGALISAAAQLGVLAAGAQLEEYPEIQQYAKNLGLVFQIVDDILDVTADQSELGKPVGSDSQQGKTTFVSLVGAHQSKQEAGRLTREAMELLAGTYGDRADFLCDFAEQLQERVK